MSFDLGSDIKQQKVVIGSVGAPYGVEGGVHVNSYTDCPNDILNYNKVNWYLNNQKLKEKATEYKIKKIKPHTDRFVAFFDGVEDRDTAASLTNSEISILRENLPSDLSEGEHYWVDLIGLDVIDQNNKSCGVINEIIATGANDVLIIDYCIDSNIKAEELLIPYTKDTVINVDLENKKIKLNLENYLDLDTDNKITEAKIKGID